MAREIMIKRSWIQVPGSGLHQSQGLVRDALTIVGPAAFGVG